MPKILIVDDDPCIRLLLRQTLEELEDEGVDFSVTDNGETALEIIRNERPNVVFLDVMMPRMNGFDVCKAIKADPDLLHVNILLLTVKGQNVDKRKGVEVGADFYMTKPFNPEEVLGVARKFLGKLTV